MQELRHRPELARTANYPRIHDDPPHRRQETQSTSAGCGRTVCSQRAASQSEGSLADQYPHGPNAKRQTYVGVGSALLRVDPSPAIAESGRSLIRVPTWTESR